jgi:lipoprotein-releasing system permease protein
MQGFEVDLRETLMGGEPHVLASKDNKVSGGTTWMQIMAAARAQPGQISVAPFAGGILYVEHAGAQTGLPTLGLAKADAGFYIDKISKNLIEGSLDLADGTLVISDMHAQEIGVSVGDEISVYPSQNVNTMLRNFRAANEEEDKAKKKAAYEKIKLYPKKLTVAGIVRGERGGFYGYMSLKTGQEIYALGQEVSGVAIELKDPDQAAQFADALKPAAPGWEFQLWTNSNEARLAAMANEQTMMQLVLSVIALVAAFSVMNTTITVTTQKRREIGVLTALGCRRGQVVLVFLYQAIFVGVLGTGLGLVGGLVVLHFRNELRSILAVITSGQVHAVEGVFLATIPAHVQPWDIALTCAISLLLCVLAGLLPAWFASRMDSAVALRD